MSEGRIWDFRDAFIAISESYGTNNAMTAFFGDSSDPSIEGLLLDWKTDSRDESTELALLDLLSFKALAPDTSPDAGHLRETCLRLAEPIGKSLLDNSPHTIRSRVFIQWVIAKSVVGPERGNFKYLADYRGITVFPEFVRGMPYYVPIDGENPGWLPLNLTPTARQSLEMALRTSRETQDYRTEARCLQELCFGTQDPSRPLQELIELQKWKQHDMSGYVATCLTRYLTCGDAETKSILLDDMKSLGSWENPADLTDPTGAAARDVLWRALSPSPLGNFNPSIGAALKYHSLLPESFQRTIDSIIPPRDSPVSAREDAGEHGNEEHFDERTSAKVSEEEMSTWSFQNVQSVGDKRRAEKDQNIPGKTKTAN